MSYSNKGFVDLQVNGWCGVDFSEPSLTRADFTRACQRIFESGTAAFLPTIITSDMRVYESNLPVIAQAIKEREFDGRVLGLHIEGPFISPKDGARGAHPLQSVLKPDTSVLDRLIELSEDNIRLLTIAAEGDNAAALTAHATKNNICVSLGHQLAADDDLAAVATAGAKALTHLGNGLPSSINRHSNPLLSGLACDQLTAMIITDGHHLPASLIKVILRVKGVKRTVVTSDATALTDMPPGDYNMFGARVRRDESGKVFNPETGYLAGSGATMLECMNYLASLNLLSEKELIEVGFNNPLSLINMTKAANIAPPDFDKSSNSFTVA